MSALALLEQQIEAAFDLEDVETLIPWAQEVIFIPHGERTGFIRFDETPWAAEPVDSVVDPEVTTEAGVYGTQMAKTTQACVVALAAVAKLRRSFVMMWPKEAAGRKFSKSRFQPIINASPELRRLKPDDGDLFTNLELHFTTGAIGFFVGSHSAVDQKSSSVPLAIVDEIEDIAAATEKEADPITLINERSKTFTERKLFLFGSCLLENGPAWKQFQLGDQRHFFVACPHCGIEQTLEFRGPVWIRDAATGDLRQVGRRRDFRVTWDPAARIGEHEWDYEIVRASARYHCAACDGEIRDAHKRDMVRAGRWLPTAKAKIYGHRSRRINSLYALWASTSFANIAIEFLNSRTDAKRLQNFTNNWEAKPWSTGLDLADKDAVAKRLGYLTSDHVADQRAGERSGLLVDVQRSYLVWALFHFDGAGGVHLVNCGYTPTFETLRELDDKYQPDFVAVDSRYDSQKVYDAVFQRKARWLALRGDKSGPPLTPDYRFDPYTGDKSGRQGAFTITLVRLNTYTWGEDFLHRLYAPKQEDAGLPEAPGAAPAQNVADLEAPSIRDFHVFAEFPKLRDFVAQLFSEYIIDYVDAKQRPQRKWKESANNHLFDLCKYAYAIGSFLGFTRVGIETRRKIEAAVAAAAEAQKQQDLNLGTPTGGTALFNR